jgi:hypothetical protein
MMPWSLMREHGQLFDKSVFDIKISIEYIPICTKQFTVATCLLIKRFAFDTIC